MHSRSRSGMRRTDPRSARELRTLIPIDFRLPNRSSSTMPTIEARDGTKLYVKDWGSGPPVIFIHGWPLNADMWEYQMPYLAAQGLRCVAYDRRGFGRSDQPWGGYDYDTMADDLAAVIDGLGL